MSTNDNKDPKKIEEKAKEGIQGIFDFAKMHPKDLIAYILLIAGIILLFFERFAGELLLGIVFGLFYAVEIQVIVKNFNEFIEDQGIVRGIVLGVIALALFISAPGIFIGAFLAVVVKYLFNS